MNRTLVRTTMVLNLLWMVLIILRLTPVLHQKSDQCCLFASCAETAVALSGFSDAEAREIQLGRIQFNNEEDADRCGLCTQAGTGHPSPEPQADHAGHAPFLAVAYLSVISIPLLNNGSRAPPF